MIGGVTVPFEYSNLPTRPSGRAVRALGAVFPGIRRVQAEAVPYAEQWRRANRAALDDSGPVWVAIGDSMSQGVGARAFDRGFVGQLSERLQPQWPHRLVNLSVFGARVQDALDQQLPALQTLISAGVVPTVVTVVIGSNDLVSAVHRAGLVARFAVLLDHLPPGAVVSNLPNPRKEARAVDALLRARAARGELLVADMRGDGPRSWRGRLAADKFHPNDAGYAAMADVLEGPVRERLARHTMGR